MTSKMPSEIDASSRVSSVEPAEVKPCDCSKISIFSFSSRMRSCTDASPAWLYTAATSCPRETFSPSSAI